MSSRYLLRREWGPFFDSYSSGLPRTGACLADISVGMPGADARVRAHSLRVHGITFDSKADRLDVVADGLNHRIDRPRSVRVDDDGVGPLRLRIRRADGTRDVVALRAENDAAPISPGLPGIPNHQERILP